MAGVMEKYTTPVLKEYKKIWSQVILETIHPVVGTGNFEAFEWNMKFNEDKTQISLGFTIILNDVVEATNKYYNHKILVMEKGSDRQEVCQEFSYNEKTTTVQDLVRYSVQIIKDALHDPNLSLKILAPKLSTYNFDKVINDSFRLNDLKNGDIVLNAIGDVGIVIRDIKNFDITFTNIHIRSNWYNEYLECPSIPMQNIVKVLSHDYYCVGLKVVGKQLKAASQKDFGNKVIPFDKTSIYITEEEIKRKFGLDKDTTVIITKD